MTVTYTSSPQTIEIVSTNLSNFAIIDTATLEVKINCCDTVYSDTITSGEVVASTYTIDNETLFGDATLDDGIYSLTLTVEYNDGSSTTQELGCLFVDEETACLVADKISGNVDVNDYEGQQILLLEMDYFFLKNAANGCPCECNDFCAILERVWKAVDKIDCNICVNTCTEC